MQTLFLAMLAYGLGALAALLGARRSLGRWLVALGAVVGAGAGLALGAAVISTGVSFALLFPELLPLGGGLALRLDSLGAFFLVVIGVVAIPAAVYGAGYSSGERKFTQRYREIAEKTKNPLVRFLLDLIVSDEEKHYALTHAMVATLKGSLSWTKQQDALTGLYDLAEEKEELLKITEDFIRLEKEGINEYKNLNKECSHYYHGLFALLLKAMIRDSEKHVDILEFLRERLQQR